MINYPFIPHKELPENQCLFTWGCKNRRKKGVWSCSLNGHRFCNKKSDWPDQFRSNWSTICFFSLIKKSFEMFFGGHFCGTTDTPVLMSALGFKVRMDPLACMHTCLRAMDSSDSPLVSHLLISWWLARQLSLFDLPLVHVYVRFYGTWTQDRVCCTVCALPYEPCRLD